MLLKLFSDGGGDHKETLRRRSHILLAVCAVGLLTLAASLVLGHLGVLTEDHARGFYAGAGSGLAAVALAGYCSTRRTMKDEKRMRAGRIKENDERSKYVQLQAFSLTAFWFLAAAYAALMVSVLIDRTVFLTLLAVIAVFFAAWGLCWVYCNKKL